MNPIYQEFKKHLCRYGLFAFVVYYGPERYIGQLKDRFGKLICQASGKTKEEAEINLMQVWNRS